MVLTSQSLLRNRHSSQQIRLTSTPQRRPHANHETLARRARVQRGLHDGCDVRKVVPGSDGRESRGGGEEEGEGSAGLERLGGEEVGEVLQAGGGEVEVEGEVEGLRAERERGEEVSDIVF